MPEVTKIVDRHPADVHTDFAGPYRNEALLLSVEGVVYAKHWDKRKLWRSPPSPENAPTGGFPAWGEVKVKVVGGRCLD